FEGGLAAVCWVVSLVAVWSVHQIRGQIGDHQIFWLSMLGTFNLAIVLSFIVSVASRFEFHDSAGRRVARVAALAPVAALIVATVLGARQLVAATRSKDLPVENDTVRRVTQQMWRTLPSMGANHPLVRIESGLWGVGSGLILQIARTSGN